MSFGKTQSSKSVLTHFSLMLVLNFCSGRIVVLQTILLMGLPNKKLKENEKLILFTLKKGGGQKKQKKTLTVLVPFMDKFNFVLTCYYCYTDR